MPRRSRRRGDPERGEHLPLGGEPQSETPGRHLDQNGEHKDFDDGANALWSLYGKEAQAHDEALFQGILAEMDGVPTFAGLFAAVLTSFLVDSLKNLQPDPAQQSVYYQQQSIAMLAQISQQIASIAPQVPISSTPPPPYPAFKPSDTARQVNFAWLLGLVLSLCAALLATFIQQRVRSYMEALQEYDHPLKRARFRQFFFQGTWSTRSAARVVPLLIRASLLLFFFGLSISVLNVNTFIGVATTVFICAYGSLSLYSTFMSLRHPQLLYQAPFPDTLALLIRTLSLSCFGRRSPSKEFAMFKARQERVVMEELDGRKDRDVRAIRWLIDRRTANAEMEPLVLAIPGSFNTEWGQDVWKEVVFQAHGTSEHQVSSTPYPPHPLEGTAVDKLSRSLGYLFETCSRHSYFENEEARHRRMRVCVEAAASLVCHIDYRLDWSGGVGRVVSEIGQIERINSPTTTSDTSFTIRWTCLSHMVIQQVLGNNRLQVLAGYAVNGLARFQSGSGQPDQAGRDGAQRIDESLQIAWGCVEDLRQALEPWTQGMTRGQAKVILRNHEQRISELEHIKVETDGLKNVDREISLYQDAMDNATYRLIQQLPGVSFVEPHRSGPSLISDIFNTSVVTDSALVTPQLIFPGQQLQTLARLGRNLRKVLDGPLSEGYKEVLEGLKSVDQVPTSLRKPNGLMRRQLWRLQDLRDGAGLGFTVELFFLSLRRLLSISSLDESSSIFYTSTFKTITSRWEESKNSLGTHHVLLNIICDLIIPGRGIFSDYSYPESITTALVNMVGDMLREYEGPGEDIREAVREIESASPDEDVRATVREIEDAERIRMDRRELRHRALEAFPRFRSHP
ncbi:hypothetical protein EDB92DRAFT_1815149 [Lactarius akahatsu]|uniref:DUF6535 domain-containing protein n=1 Tax=Lactarius akahatsu TaxID=416441 RepID=A0AAD4QEU5_9AGAM|nr:hypothetical protein EDB92DRAFT_1815149 [Lactarius akahatsu]